MAKIFDSDKETHKIKLKRKEGYKDEISGYGGVSSDGHLLGSLGEHGLNYIDELHDKELRLILEVSNTDEMRRMLAPKSETEWRIEKEIETRLAAKGLIIKLEKELTEKELNDIRELKETIEKELKEDERAELKMWRERMGKFQKAAHEKLKSDWKDLTE